MNVFKYFFIFILCLAEVSCSYFSPPYFFQNKDPAYLSARSIPPLKIPPGVASSTIQTYYPVPHSNDQTHVSDVNLTPPGLMG